MQLLARLSRGCFSIDAHLLGSRSCREFWSTFGSLATVCVSTFCLLSLSLSLHVTHTVFSSVRVCILHYLPAWPSDSVYVSVRIIQTNGLHVLLVTMDTLLPNLLLLLLSSSVCVRVSTLSLSLSLPLSLSLSLSLSTLLLSLFSTYSFASCILITLFIYKKETFTHSL